MDFWYFWMVIHVRIFHGSFSKPFSGDTYRELGGLLGGHVAVQIYDRVYGFYYADRNHIHIFDQPNNKSSIFQNQSLHEWENIVKNKKETIISIPATQEEMHQMIEFYQKNLIEPAWDYSFWGERCASNCYRMLTLFKKVKPRNRFLSAFYPGQLIWTLKREAQQNGFMVRTKLGDSGRVWA